MLAGTASASGRSVALNNLSVESVGDDGDWNAPASVFDNTRWASFHLCPTSAKMTNWIDEDEIDPAFGPQEHSFHCAVKLLTSVHFPRA